MKSCPRPLDPIDAEALASGSEPVFAPDAASHAAACPPCSELVEGAARLLAEMEGFARDLRPMPDLAARVLRLRSFSRRERRTYAFWRPPIYLGVGLFLCGWALLTLPPLSFREQVGLAEGLLAPPLAFLRSLAVFSSELLATLPGGLEALSESLRQHRTLGAAALLLLLPLCFAWRRVLQRAASRS